MRSQLSIALGIVSLSASSSHASPRRSPSRSRWSGLNTVGQLSSASGIPSPSSTIPDDELELLLLELLLTLDDEEDDDDDALLLRVPSRHAPSSQMRERPQSPSALQMSAH